MWWFLPLRVQPQGDFDVVARLVKSLAFSKFHEEIRKRIVCSRCTC
ncbi:hypothetical protein RSSM_03217 [Rhodopirellula sallentina SM41]|uniref:Uncharacterized protein n=1 Tax=Rhodopirellula sallentina SM41 TaxID=1263870 RepID=M5U1U1_9BACT|nr:hypothetical protein RSSM_03217 [Rhodopirellula sallentina SM41]